MTLQTRYLSAAVVVTTLVLTYGTIRVYPQQSDDIKAIQAVIADFAVAYETRDIDALMKTLVDSDEVTLFLPNPFAPLLIEGRATARSVITGFFDSIPRTSVIRMTTHDNAYQFYDNVALNWNYTSIYLTVGGTPYHYVARNTNVFLRVNGKWRILHIHGSPTPKSSAALQSTIK